MSECECECVSVWPYLCAFSLCLFNAIYAQFLVFNSLYDLSPESMEYGIWYMVNTKPDTLHIAGLYCRQNTLKIETPVDRIAAQNNKQRAYQKCINAE